MSATERPWLEPFTWDFVTAQNAVLCEAKNALHKPTSDGHDETRGLWLSRHRLPMTLLDAIELCRICHRKAPFCFYNGNTFAGIARTLIMRMNLAPEQAFLVRSLAGHIVAGVASDEEIQAFQAFSDSLD